MASAIATKKLLGARRPSSVTTFGEIADMLKSMEDLADLRGLRDRWWALARRMLVLRARVNGRHMDGGFAEAIDDLCMDYDAFVTSVLPNPEPP